MPKKPISIPAPLRTHSISVEPFLPLKVAAATLGLPYHMVQRATHSGAFPAYRFGSRIRVRVSEIEAVITLSKTGGRHE